MNVMLSRQRASLFAALAISFCPNLFSASPGPITLTADTPWIISADEPEAMQRALADVKADWYRVFGHLPLVVSNPAVNWQGPVLYLGCQAPWLKHLVGQPFSGKESFRLITQTDTSNRTALVATGADLRGSIYAAYALSEEILGQDPWYFWTDNLPARRDQIEVPAGFRKEFGPPTFNYRGWFINDEDLLGGYAPDPMKENVCSL